MSDPPPVPRGRLWEIESEACRYTGGDVPVPVADFRWMCGEIRRMSAFRAEPLVCIHTGHACAFLDAEPGEGLTDVLQRDYRECCNAVGQLEMNVRHARAGQERAEAELALLRSVPSVPPSEGLRGTFTVREMAGALCPECQKGADVHREPAQFATGDAAYWHHTADPYGPACPAASLWEYAFFASVPSVPAPPSEHVSAEQHEAMRKAAEAMADRIAKAARPAPPSGNPDRLMTADGRAVGEELLEYQRAGECTLVESGIIGHFVNWMYSRRTINGWPWYARPGAAPPSEEPTRAELGAPNPGECQAGIGPGKASERRKCRAPAEWVNHGGMSLCDRHARYAHGPRKGTIQETLTPWREDATT